MSRGIWVISNGVSKQRLANHVAKLETLTFCLQKLFWQYELSVSLGASERQARKDKDNFCLTFSYKFCFISERDWYVTAVLATGLQTLSTEKTLNTKQWSSVQGRTHCWVTIAFASAGYSQTSSLGLIWTCLETVHIWGPD